MSVYQPCDIRGPVEELSPGLYHRWGQALAGQLPAGARVAIGGDVRLSTPAFLGALHQGLSRGGAKVTNLGILPTPMVYFAQRRFGHAAAAIVTASHNPPGYNGLKWMLGSTPPTQEDVQRLAHAARGGQEDVGPAEAGASCPPAQLELAQAYVGELAARYQKVDQGGFCVVLDGGHGCWSGRGREYLTKIWPSVLVEAIHDQPNGLFPGRSPDCAKPEHLNALAQAVVRQKADLGIAFDGDGDRVAFVDDLGQPLSAEQATWVLLESLGSKLKGERFVYDLKFSDQVAQASKNWGAAAMPERSGHAFIRAGMIRSQALFGAEISGHYFYRELGYSDDGFDSGLRMAAHLIRSGRRLSHWRQQCPPVFMTPDLRLKVQADLRGQIIEQAKEAFAHRPQSHIDGTRIDFEDGWALVRASVTEPSLTFRFEGRTAAGLERVVQQFCAALGEWGTAVRLACEKSAQPKPSES